MKLEKMSLGRQCAALIANWLISGAVEISHLLLAENNLGEEGLEELKIALATSTSIIVVDISLNNIGQKSAATLRYIFVRNQSIQEFKYGCPGPTRNRIGPEGAKALAAGFSAGKSLVQMLYMKSVSLSNNELAVLAEGLENYPFLHTIDLAENRLQGREAGVYLARIIKRQTNLKGGFQLDCLLLGHNKIGTKGFEEICKAITNIN